MSIRHSSSIPLLSKAKQELNEINCCERVTDIRVDHVLIYRFNAHLQSTTSILKSTSTPQAEDTLMPRIT